MPRQTVGRRGERTKNDMETTLLFAVVITPADDLQPTKDHSFGERRTRLIENAVATFRTNLEKAVGPGQLPSEWGRVEKPTSVATTRIE